jgi:hypothetical protein
MLVPRVLNFPGTVGHFKYSVPVAVGC